MQTSPEIVFFLWLNANAQTPAWVVEAARFSTSGLPWLLPVLALGDGLRSPAGRKACLRIAAGMALAWLCAHTMRNHLDLPRPAALQLGMQWMQHGQGKGFPSLHAAGALAFAYGVALAGRPWFWRALAWAGAAAICWSRICLGLHFPMDVICGGLIGAVGARLAFGFPWRRQMAAARSSGIAGSEA
ncbi:phosphatase PAP2 family protein [Xylophilus rhododendri]|uniref:Phosphatase PAP2 family protein n=1 Tax=Xylophilus rhododendri TaxID=2697032 RepID=A0A857JC57_9BURK|nr:phosphatase PAP2 family protein [Xylophilus rhododendri]QHJ00329.1 phosphatase PAP2 family protein [Xylophilus rhododendri]